MTMTEKQDHEQQKAELLWRYIEELKQAENPDEVQFVAVTSGECAEAVGLMETAAEGHALARAASAPNCRREVVRQRLRAAIAGAREPAAAMVTSHSPRAFPLLSGGWWRDWITASLSGRSTGWAVAVAALVALLWGVTRPQPGVSPRPAVTAISHTDAIEAMPALLDSRLDVARTAAVWEHLIHCRHCYDIYEEKWRRWQQDHRPDRQSGLWTPGPRLRSSEFVPWVLFVVDNQAVGVPIRTGRVPPRESTNGLFCALIQ
jgi:hypothetical protein